MKYTYRVIGIKDCCEWFVFKHAVIPAKGRKKQQIYPCLSGDNPVARFPTKELARAERDRLEQEQSV